MALLNSLRGSVNLITGCGSGLGKATLQWFLRQGSGPILAIDKFYEQDFLESLDIEANDRKKISLEQHDTFDVAKVESSIAEFVQKHGSFTNVINVAGVALAFLFTSKGSPEAPYDRRHAQDLLEYNTIGTFNIIRTASKPMIEASLNEKDNPTPRCIINASCTSTTNPLLGQTFYAASKASIDSMTLPIARELARFNIRCNTINVGFFETELVNRSAPKVLDYLKEVSLCPSRIGKPEEFAHLVQTIVENQMINGCCIKIDGGTRISHLW